MKREKEQTFIDILHFEYNKNQKYCDKRIIWILITLDSKGMPKHETK